MTTPILKITSPDLIMPPVVSGHVVYVRSGEPFCREFTTACELNEALPHIEQSADFQKTARDCLSADFAGFIVLQLLVIDGKLAACDDSILHTLRSVIGIGAYSHGFIRCCDETVEAFTSRWIGVGRSLGLSELLWKAGLSFRLDCYNHPKLRESK